MRAPILAVCGALAFGWVGAARAVDKAAQTAAAVGAMDREFARRAGEIGTAAAFRDYMDPADGLVFNGAGKPARGASAIFQAMGGRQGGGKEGGGKEGGGKQGGGRLVWVPLSAWGSKGEDLGVTTGDWAQFGRDPDKPVVTGRYVTVWRKDRSGHWKGLIDIGEPDAKPMDNEATRK